MPVSAATQNAVFDSNTDTIHLSSGASIADAVAVPDDGKFIQMGAGSTITLKFPGSYVAKPDGTSAADLRIDIYDALYRADAKVFVSLNGTDWTSLGVKSDTANIDIDLDGIGSVKYVKLDQANNYIDPAYPDLGFDLDAVVALNVGDEDDNVVAACPEGTVKEDFQSGLTVSSDGSSITSKALENGKAYIIEANGTYNYGPNIADPKCSNRDGVVYGPGWVPGENLPSPWANFLQILINGDKVSDNWGTGCDTTDHKYSTLYNGDGKAINFSIKDNAYGDNSGSLNVDIYQCVEEQEPVTRSAEITEPSAPTIPAGTVNFAAHLVDDDPDAIQWAVRKGTCDAGVGTIFGNVDGKNNTATINKDNLGNQTFSFTGDMTNMDAGMYCFIYNPVEDSGETGIRLTKEFQITIVDGDGDGIADSRDNCPVDANADQADLDGDGIGDICDDDIDGDGAEEEGIDNCPLVANSDQANFDGDKDGDVCDTDDDNDEVGDGDDECEKTKADAKPNGDKTYDVTYFADEQANPLYDEKWGQNRWLWTGIGEENGWRQKFSNSKGTTYKSGDQDTYGCSCLQILDMLKDEGLGNFGGHYKFGCSNSVVEDFSNNMKDGELDGRYFIENLKIPAIGTEMKSTEPLMSGVDYLLKASGTANAGDGIEFDAKYSFKTGSTEWTDAVLGYQSLGTELLDLFVDGDSVNWGSYNSEHKYKYEMEGNGEKAAFKIYDTYPSNNSGNLYVDIYAEL